MILKHDKVLLEESDRKLWKTDDKQWMDERKNEWRYISKNLDIIKDECNAEIKKKHFKYFKNLFFKGEYEISEEDILHFERPIPALLLFVIWFYPIKTTEAYKGWRRIIQA